MVSRMQPSAFKYSRVCRWVCDGRHAKAQICPRCWAATDHRDEPTPQAGNPCREEDRKGLPGLQGSTGQLEPLTSSLLTGEMMAEEANCAATSSTGSTRYLLASSQPIGGAPLTRGSSQAVPAPEQSQGTAQQASPAACKRPAQTQAVATPWSERKSMQYWHALDMAFQHVSAHALSSIQGCQWKKGSTCALVCQGGRA